MLTSGDRGGVPARGTENSFPPGAAVSRGLEVGTQKDGQTERKFHKKFQHQADRNNNEGKNSLQKRQYHSFS
jgi:hypothetical protein